jgi:hypothetical protein
MKKTKADLLLEASRKTLARGDRNTAKEIVVVALTTDDAIEALDRLLPQVPEADPGVLELSEHQIAKVTALAKSLPDSKLSKKILATVSLVPRTKTCARRR